jgi:uncharacterized protein YqjF (DUF2071 family)
VSRFADARKQAQTLRALDHRPWPIPSRPWVMGQTWKRLLFAHWRVSHDALRPHVPKPLILEEWDGSAWIALTPFRVEGLRPRGVPPLPLFSSFFELNCRTYVRAGDRPGIWFFSLDASSRAAVEAARRTYRLPYWFAQIDARGEIFDARRVGEDAQFSARYRGRGNPAPAKPGTLEHFLTERYCLYGGDGGRVRAEIHHPPWLLQPAEATVEQINISPVSLEGEPLYHYAERQDVLVWSPERIETEGSSPLTRT